MKTFASFVLILCSGIGASLDGALAQTPEIDSVRFSEAALAFSSGAIQKTSPIDGTVNLITGDNQSTGNRMLLGKLGKTLERIRDEVAERRRRALERKAACIEL